MSGNILASRKKDPFGPQAVQSYWVIKKTGFGVRGGFLSDSHDRRRVVAVFLAGPPRGRGGFLRGAFSALS